MPATRELPLTLPIDQRTTILKLVARGPGASFDVESLYGLAAAGLIEVNNTRRVALTARGELVYARLAAGE